MPSSLAATPVGTLGGVSSATAGGFSDSTSRGRLLTLPASLDASTMPSLALSLEMMKPKLVAGLSIHC